jgi:repressor LexA
MNTLTSRQTEVLQCIRRQIDSTGMPPTRSELAKLLGFKSINAAEQHLKALAKKKVIELLPGASRGIRVLCEENNGIPIIGRVAAGQPILAQQHIEGHHKIPPQIFHPQADYLLRVNGMSMRDIGILEGDLLAVHATKQVHNGNIIVARIGDEVTVKRFKKYGMMVHLLPENSAPEYEAIIVDLRRQELTIEGLGVGVLRNRMPL